MTSSDYNLKDVDNSEQKIWTSLNTSERRGKYFFDKYCVVCHGKYGKGDGFNSYNLLPKPIDLSDSLYLAANTNSFLYQMIALGGRGVNRSSQMPAYRYTLKENEIHNIIGYIRSLKKVH